jgi:glycosyltransferase involved in cell wall biosynthesis
VEVVGSPRLDDLPARQAGPSPVVALAWHWDLHLVPETLSALAWYRPALEGLARRFDVIGTGHPRRQDLAALYARLGIAFVSFEEVCRRADVLAFDNTSAGFEFAATGRPVVVLDAPWYRREVRHGLRFWEAADVGVRINRPEHLADALERALACAPADARAREEALERVYTYRHDAADRAAAAILSTFGS